ncbi:MAG: acetyl-CoA carboxylase carboxyl transferase subunit alpha [Eggerthellaceae bacterium]|jgi:acetyl-CoA carboxylase carboxyl transferase alpha subunit/acetyl-CoA carboxylase carboxyl transferase beta subunit
MEENSVNQQAGTPVVTVEDTGRPAETKVAVPAGAAQEEAKASVLYALNRLADTVKGPILVVGYGNAMKAVVRACSSAGIGQLFVTGSEDKRRAFSCSGRAEVVALSKTFDSVLFSNEYAILDAAERCGAKALLLASPEHSDTPLLRAAAAQRGILVLQAIEGSRSLEAWVRLEPDPVLVKRTFSWEKCPKCKRFHEHEQIFDDGGTCPTCGRLYRLDSDERIRQVFDPGSFEEWDAQMEEPDPLDFPDYDSFLNKGRRSGHAEAVRTGAAALDGSRVAFGIMESTFMMGSMGYVVGEKLARMVERATREQLPVIIFSASGGARMQEGLVSLMQMAKVSVALEAHGRAGLPYFSVITDPTTGGVTASFAMQGDVIVSEPHALIGFAGQRVIQDTIKQTLPPGFQTAEFALNHGLIDAIVERCDLRDYLIELVQLHDSARLSSARAAWIQAPADTVEATVPGADANAAAATGAEHSVGTAAGGQGKADTAAFSLDGIGSAIKNALRQAEDMPVIGDLTNALGMGGDAPMLRAMRNRDMADAPGVKPLRQDGRQQDETASENPAWESVMLARNIHRPTAVYYIDHMVDDFIELHGDRGFGDDGAIVAGLGWIDGCPVTVIAEEKGADLKQRIARNFGCPQPWGYRKARRLMEQAEKFGRPIVCLVDTQGAFCGMEAEERGQGNAIADNLMTLAGLTVPVVSIVLGEGGSGGALALALGNCVAMQEHAVYSVLSPEGFASILWKDRSRAAEAAAVMKMSAAEAYQLGIIEEVVSEGPQPAHENPAIAAENVHGFVSRALRGLSTMDGEQLRAQRYDRFRRM